MSVYARLWRRTGTRILMVTHDIAEAVFLAYRIYVLTGRPGRVRAKVVVDPLGAESTAALHERVSGLLGKPEPAAPSAGPDAAPVGEPAGAPVGEPAGAPGRAVPATSEEGRLACT